MHKINTNLITINELYQQLKNNGTPIGKDKLYQLAKTRSFPSLKIGKRIYILEDKVDDYFNNKANNFYE